MEEKEYINRIVSAIRKVPEKSLLIIELANSIPVKNGVFDEAVLLKLQPEIKLAIKEAEVYGSHTLMAVEALVKGCSNVGFGIDN